MYIIRSWGPKLVSTLARRIYGCECTCFELRGEGEHFTVFRLQVLVQLEQNQQLRPASHTQTNTQNYLICYMYCKTIFVHCEY